MPRTINIAVIDDDPTIHHMVGELIRSVGYQMSSYLSANEFLNVHHDSLPDCLIVDVRLPGTSGLELQEILLGRHIHIPIIFITAFGDIPMAVRAIKNGAVDFLTKPANNQLFLESINKAIKKQRVGREELETQRNVYKRYERLTPREREIMHLMVQGKLTKVIADELHISASTVELHRAKVMKKMESHSLAELVSVALSYGLVTQACSNSL